MNCRCLPKLVLESYAARMRISTSHARANTATPAEERVPALLILGTEKTADPSKTLKSK